MSNPPPSSRSNDVLPRAFGRYSLFERIGKGGMAEIFLARQKTELGGARLVVVKQILPELAAQPRFADLITAEAKLAARLSHANLVQVTDLGRHDGRLFIAMDYVEGLDLSDLLRRCSQGKIPVPVEFSLFIVSEMLRGLDYAHRRLAENGKPLGLVHRDVSPSNVLLSFEGEVKLCDFGIAHAIDAASSPSGVVEGKAGYMSPEHAAGEPLDARADVFAAGIVLWEVLAGKRFYKAEPGEKLIDVARLAPARPLPERGLPFEHELSSIVARAVSRSHADRYSSAAAMLRDLESYAARADLRASPLKLGEFLRGVVGEELVEQRRAKERAIRAMEKGPPVVMSKSKPASGAPISAPPEKPWVTVAPTPTPRKRSAMLPAMVVLALVLLAAAVFAARRALGS